MINLLVENFLKPKTLEEAYDMLISNKKNMVIAGGAWIKLSIKNVLGLISLDDLNLNKIEVKDDSIEIGSMATLREVELSNHLNELYDGVLSSAVHKIMGINIRNLATIGGSVMGRFAFSDIYPPLLVMDTKLVFYKQGEISLSDFLANPKMEKDILLKIVIKKEEGRGFFKKVATTPLDFAIINIAVSKTLAGFKICLGSTPYIGALAKDAMIFLNSKKVINEEVLDKTVELVLGELKISKNVRASKTYKEELASVYVKRGIRKVISDVN